jgi:hypothetical protein
MAKTNVEKLGRLLAAAATLKNEAVVGDQEGNFAQESVDQLSAEIESAQNVAVSEGVTEEQAGDVISQLSEVVKVFKASAIKPPEPTKTEPEKVTLKGVVLKGEDSQKEGNHTVFIGRTIIAFQNGKAEVSKEVAAQLIDQGIADEETGE